MLLKIEEVNGEILCSMKGSAEQVVFAVSTIMAQEPIIRAMLTTCVEVLETEAESLKANIGKVIVNKEVIKKTKNNEHN